MNQIRVMNYSVFCSSLPDQFDGVKVINTLNAHSYYIAKKDVVFRTALQASDILLPDGISVVIASMVLRGQRIRKIAGADLHLHVLQILNKQSGSCFYLGSKEMTLEKIKCRLKEDFPNIRMGMLSPPFREFTTFDNESILHEINCFRPDVLFVGMTAPKQEKWVLENEARINAHVICSIGAVFDFYAGTVKRPSSFWIKVGLEFLVRFLKEPGRLWRRNVISTPIFLFDMIRFKFKIL